MTLPADPETREAVLAAMRALGVRERFQGEVSASLAAKGHSEPAIEAALAFLLENRLLDDGRAAERLLAGRTGKRSIGRARVREELLRKGACELQAEEAMAAIDDESELEAMRCALESRTWKPGDRIRAARFLASRGFDPDLIEIGLRTLFDMVED